MRTLAVANLKGGTAKTTTAVFVAHALSEIGLRVLLVDADPQGSSLNWEDYSGGFPFPVIALPTRTLHKTLPGVAGDSYDVAVVDTPPLSEQTGIVLSALRAAADVLVPVAPTPAEIERIPAVRDAVDNVADLRRDGCSPRMAVLLTRTIANAASTVVWREQLANAGHRVLRVQVPRLERFAQAFGRPVIGAASTAYGDAVSELFKGVRA